MEEENEKEKAIEKKKQEIAYNNEKIANALKQRLAKCTKEEFERIFSLYPKGNPESAFQMLRYHVIKEITFNGNYVTIELIESKWKDYLKKVEEEGTQEKYIKGLESFIKSKDYNINFYPKVGKSFIDRYKQP